MKYSNLGKLILTERKKKGWEQSELAVRVSKEQQTISRWEKGDSRPQREDLLRLVDIFSVNKDVWFAQAGYDLNEPDISLSPYLPLQILSPEKFELFCKVLIQALNPKSDVHLYGTQGHKQDGIDLYSKDSTSVLDYQCKRHQQFGPADVKKAVKKTTFKASHHYLLLSRNASPLARKEIDKYIKWSLWDRQDISEKVRGLSNKDDAIRIVDTFFPGKRKAFLGVEDPSPWLTPKEFFLPLEERSKLFSHGWNMVGRQKELQYLKKFGDQKDFQAIIISGRGGIGKSRLLKAWVESIDKSINIRFISNGLNIEPKDLELLPKGKSYLVIDDSHDRNDILVILNGVVRTRPETKIILSSRPYGITRLQDDLTQSGVIYDSGETITLGDLSIEEAEKLAKEILNDPDVSGNEKLARKIAEITRDCPLATVVGSRLVGKGLIRPEFLNNEKKFRDTLLKSFRDVIAGEIGGKNPDDIRELLGFLATVQPFNTSDPKFQEALEKVLSKPFDKTIRDISILEEAGVLLRRGYHLRVAPDLLADYIRFEVSYDEKSGNPTKYIDRVFELLQDELAMHLLVNISQLDWRLSEDKVQSMLLDAVWKKIFSEIKTANNADRCLILKKLKDVAYYQPKQLLELVEYVKDNPSKTPEDIQFSNLYKYEHLNVLSELPEILRRLCYHIDYFPHCVNLIWEIGRGDSRRTNQYPEHGLRILQELAQYDVYELTGKGVEVNELMLDAVKAWLKDTKLADYVHSPLDVLDELLDKDSTTDTYETGKITFHSFGVHYEHTKHIREEALKIVVECAKSTVLKTSLRAIKSLGHALEEPRALYGRKIEEDEAPKWKPFQLSVLDEIESIVKIQKHPIVYVELKKILAWHVQNSPSDEIKKRGRLLFEKLSKSFEVKLVQSLDQNRDRDWLLDEEKYDYQKLEEMSISFRKAVAGDFIEKYPNPKDGFSKLNGLFGELENYKEGSPFPIIFFIEMTKLNPEYVISMCDEIIKNPKSLLSKYFGYFIYGLIGKDKKNAVTLLKRAIETEEKNLQISIADYYWRGKWVEYLDEKNDIANIIKLLTCEVRFVKKLTLGALGRLGKIKPVITKKLLLSVDLEKDKDLADEFCAQLDKEHYYDPDLLSDNELQQILNKLELVNDIDGYNIEEFLDYASKRMPLVVVELLLNRIDHSKKISKDEKYQALSYSSRRRIEGVKNTSNYLDVLRKVRNKILNKDWQDQFWIPKLYRMLSNNFDNTGLEILLEWVKSGEKEKLVGVGAIIEDAPENFVFNNPTFVSEMLQRAKSYGHEFLKSIRNALSHSTVYRSKHGTPGQPMVEDVELKEHSESMVNKFPTGSLEYELYDSLLKRAKWEIQDQLKEDDEFLD